MRERVAARDEGRTVYRLPCWAKGYNIISVESLEDECRW